MGGQKRRTKLRRIRIELVDEVIGRTANGDRIKPACREEAFRIAVSAVGRVENERNCLRGGLPNLEMLAIVAHAIHSAFTM